MKYPTVLINGVKVRVDSEGRYNLNDLHESATEGGKASESQRPGAFLQSAQVRRFVDELSDATKIASVKTIKGGKDQGTWGMELVAIRYAAWIEPKFEIQVYNTFAEAKRQKAMARVDRNTARLEYRPMTDAIKHEREAQGKEIKPYHFSNEADLINRIALGMTAAKFRVYHDIEQKREHP
nr:KilA-N domain-containing protein [Enterobacter ludwigii]